MSYVRENNLELLFPLFLSWTCCDVMIVPACWIYGVVWSIPQESCMLNSLTTMPATIFLLLFFSCFFSWLIWYLLQVFLQSCYASLNTQITKRTYQHRQCIHYFTLICFFLIHTYNHMLYIWHTYIHVYILIYVLIHSINAYYEIFLIGETVWYWNMVMVSYICHFLYLTNKKPYFLIVEMSIVYYCFL